MNKRTGDDEGQRDNKREKYKKGRKEQRNRKEEVNKYLTEKTFEVISINCARKCIDRKNLTS